MRRRLGYGLALGAVLAAAWLVTQPPAPPPGMEAAPRLPHPQATRAQHARDVADWQQRSLARPLFAPSRRPPQPPQIIAAALPPPPPPRLTAVLVGPFGNSAVFVPSGGEHSIVVQEGGQVGPYRIRRIRPDEVVVEAPDGEHILHPGFRGPVEGQPAPEQRAGSAASRRVASLS